MMKPREIFEFDKYAYQDKILRNYNYYHLAHKIYSKRRAVVGSGVAVGSSIISTSFSGGASLISSAWSLRSLSVERQKLELLEQEWARRGQLPLRERKRDMIIPIILNTIMGLFMFNVDLNVENPMTPPSHPVQAGWLPPTNSFGGYAVGAYYTPIQYCPLWYYQPGYQPQWY
ncbi:hypothetical protein AX16_002152 [Volvariella volvacea WC 439]|nr:hypothetical protein AX16_002152 [Volvariella volvacea WC 439]